MKIRQGFVSNSSTSSFCIYGASYNKPKKEFVDEVGEETSFYEVLEDFIEKNSKRLGLESHNPDGDGFYIGVGATDIKDDETGAQFKARVVSALHELENALGLKTPKNYRYHEYAWSDG